jgi:hypothetical protein
MDDDRTNRTQYCYESGDVNSERAWGEIMTGWFANKSQWLGTIIDSDGTECCEICHQWG